MSNGSFSGNPKTEWLSERGDDRDMLLLEPFWYIDPQGRRWDVSAGSMINGASIPRTLWSSLGSPYTGDYRRASVVHDAAINTPGITRSEADTMFYHACLAGGCPPLQARLLYAGVRIGSWASQSALFASDAAFDSDSGSVALQDAAYRLPGQQSPRELEARARYTLIATELASAGDDFEQIRATVDRHLGAAGMVRA
jgi:Protein of unknown function (DUF1353)